MFDHFNQGRGIEAFPTTVSISEAAHLQLHPFGHGITGLVQTQFAVRSFQRSYRRVNTDDPIKATFLDEPRDQLSFATSQIENGFHMMLPQHVGHGVQANVMKSQRFL